MLFTRDSRLADEIRSLRAASLSSGGGRLRWRRLVEVLARCLAHENWIYGLSRRALESSRVREKQAVIARQEPLPDPHADVRTWMLPSTFADRALISRHANLLGGMVAHRKKLADLYRSSLADLDTLGLPRAERGALSHFPLRLAVDKRNRVRGKLFQRGIDCATFFPLLKTFSANACPDSVRSSREILALPLNMDMGASDAAKVAATLREVLMSL